MIAGIILAAGASTRMGSPKALLDYRGETFVERLVRLFSRVCDPVIVALGNHPEPIRARIEGCAEVVINPDPDRGQLSSLQTALAALPPKADGTPQYTTNYITYRLDASDNTTTVMDSVNGKGPFNLPGAVKVDGRNNGDKGPAGTPDEGRIVRIDPNPDLQGKVYGARIMCNYVKMPDPTKLPPIPAGFQVTQTQIAVPNSQPQTMVRITMTLVFTDARNKVLEETLETKIYLRNSQ